MHVLLSPPYPCRTELRYRESGATGSKTGLRSGITGLKVRRILFLPGLTIRTLSISVPLNVSIPVKLACLCFLPDSTLHSYHPGSRNIKPDALSRQFLRDSSSLEPAPVLPRSCLVAPLFWDIEERVKAASADQQVRVHARQIVSSFPHDSGQKFCSDHTQGSPVIWAFTGPRGSCKDEDVLQFVRACPNCNQHRPSHQVPAGHLHHLPITSRCWSHISLHFVTGLPPLFDAAGAPGGRPATLSSNPAIDTPGLPIDDTVKLRGTKWDRRVAVH